MTPRVYLASLVVPMVSGMRVYTVDVRLLPELPGSHPPLRTLEEGRFCAVYTVNGQGLCTAFIITADTHNHCCSISHINI